MPLCTIHKKLHNVAPSPLPGSISPVTLIPFSLYYCSFHALSRQPSSSLAHLLPWSIKHPSSMTVKIPHTASSSNVTLPLQTSLILSDSRNPLFCTYIPFFNSTHQILSKFAIVYLFLLPVYETIPLFSYFSGKLRIFNRCLLKESSSLQLCGEQGILKLLKKNIYIFNQPWKLMEYSFCC